MNNRRSWVALMPLLLIGLFAVRGEGQQPQGQLPPEAQEVIEKASALKSYRAHFTLTAQEENGEQVKLTGTLLYEAPNRRRLEIQEEDSAQATQLLVSDGTTEWQYFPANQTVYKAAPPPEIPGPHRAFGEVQQETVRFVEYRGADPDRLARFEAEPIPAVTEGAPVPIKMLRVDVGQDGLVRELTLLDTNDQPVLSQHYGQIELDVPIPKESFTFTMPSDAQVVEPAAEQRGTQ